MRRRSTIAEKGVAVIKVEAPRRLGAVTVSGDVALHLGAELKIKAQ
jgi:hypothetical protein